jgi:hypothetical protein
MKRWSVDRVADMLDFSCGNRFGATSAMVRMQTEGVAAVCEILRKRHVAYLADEVGLGKTMQALGVAACLSQGRTLPRVLVMSPRKLVQNAWQAEHARFAARERGGDGRHVRDRQEGAGLQIHRAGCGAGAGRSRENHFRASGGSVRRRKASEAMKNPPAFGRAFRTGEQHAA